MTARFGDPALVVPTFHRYTKPSAVRDLRKAYFVLLDAAKAEAAALLAGNASLDERWGMASVVAWLQACIAACDEWLRLVARRGGRGVLVQGAGPSPASAAGASIAHGCAALSPAIGTRVHKASGAAEATPENRLFHAQQGKPCQR